MNIELNSGELDDYFTQEAQQQSGLTVWQFLDLVNSGRFLRGIEREAISMAVEEVYQEIIGDVLKQVKSSLLVRKWEKYCAWFCRISLEWTTSKGSAVATRDLAENSLSLWKYPYWLGEYCPLHISVTFWANEALNTWKT